MKKLFFVICIIIAVSFSLIGCQTPDFLREKLKEDDITTDTWSSQFENTSEKIAFLEKYLVMPSEVLDAEYHIVYYDNSTGLVPGPSDWDVRVALEIESENIPLWHEGFRAISSNEIDLKLWEDLQSLGSISWNDNEASCYQRETDTSYLIVFPDTSVILKAMSTTPYSAIKNPET